MPETLLGKRTGIVQRKVKPLHFFHFAEGETLAFAEQFFQR
jgi:hypothetical protein